MSFSKIDSTFNISDTDRYPTYDFEFDNQKFKAIVPRITNYVHKEFSKSAAPGAGSTQRTYAFVDPFFMVFKDNKLYNWGYLYEFKNNASNKTMQFLKLIYTREVVNKSVL